MKIVNEPIKCLYLQVYKAAKMLAKGSFIQTCVIYAGSYTGFQFGNVTVIEVVDEPIL